MALRKPESVEECIYFTQRSLGDQQQGYATVWVFKQKCEKCSKALMGKPRDKKTGKVLIRAKEYACESCGNTVEKTQYEASLMACVEYTCPACNNQGEKEIPFKRRKIEGIETLRLQCDKCNANIDITKKMKNRKSKGVVDDSE